MKSTSDHTSTPASASHPSAGHPTVETWVDYHADALPEAERERLQRHLAGCRQCVDLVLDLDAFVEPVVLDTPGVSDFEKAAVWRTLAGARKTSRWPAVAALAASLLFATVGFAWWSGQRRTIQGLETRIAGLSRPQVNAVILDLIPSTVQRSAGSAEPVTVLPADAGITLALHLDDSVDYPDFELAISDADGNELWRGRGFEPSEVDSFYLALPAGYLPAGEYQLQLSGLDKEQKVLLQTYPIRLQ